jgi:radical SAM modification target selenobiotic family peptide
VHRRIRFISSLYETDNKQQERRSIMDTKDLKKYLAGFTVAGLLAGAGLAMGAATDSAESS